MNMETEMEDPQVKEEEDDNDLFAAEEEDVNMDEDEVLPQSILPDQQSPLQVSHHHSLPFQLALNTTATATANSAAHTNFNINSNSNSNTFQSTLLDRIITPSPFAQHNTGTSRFRTAFSRILADPVNDTEAWLAVITETTSINATIVDKAAPENYAKLDWVESCYGALIYRFPYTVLHVTGVAEILLQQIIAIHAAPKHPIHADAMAQRTRQCQAKLALVFQKYLDVTPLNTTGTSTSTSTSTGRPIEPTPDTLAPTPDASPPKLTPKPLALMTWVVELWLVYIHHVSHTASVSSDSNSSSSTSGNDPQAVREAVTAAYNLATAAAGDAPNNHVLWTAYRDFVQSWTITTNNNIHAADGSTGTNIDHALASKQMQQLRSVYQRMIVQPMLGLDGVWAEYEAFEKHQSEALAAALIQELAPKYQHARTIYLERMRVLEDAQLGRLATPPVSQKSNDETAAGTTSATTNDSDYQTKRLDEYHLLRVWKTRCSYERTNPGRLGTSDLQRRIRHTFCAMACTLTRHPETWHMWSTWELLVSSGGNSAAAPVDTTTANGGIEAENGWSASTMKAIQVLQLGQEHIPDATLLALAEAQITETRNPAAGVAVLDAFLKRSPNTLSFILYQQIVRRHEGREKARMVFARARRILTNPESSKKSKTQADVVATETGEADADIVENQVVKKQDIENGKRWVVTNRLDESIGATVSSAPKLDVEITTKSKSEAVAAGPVTWHLYAAHAVMEHRINRAPEIAARVYELGLRKHASFLTIPPYIQRYAQLLLELNDMVNLRALLTRAVAACEAEEKREALASLWDMTLYFESIGGNSDTASASTLQAIEKGRHQALLGPDVEDVATGGVVGAGDSALIGAQKSTIAEQLIRSEGYETSSRIVNGMKRLVDVLAVNGHWGTGDFESISRRAHAANSDNAAQFSGGKSDASYQVRLQFEQLIQAGVSPEYAAMDRGVAGSKMLTARERLSGVSAVGGVTGPAGGTAIMLAIQQSADWLRPLLLLLPASQLRLPIVAKPPPHLTEMALSTLRQNALPAERPADDVSKKGSKRSISANNDGSSDEEDGGGASGYGAAFRSRQRVRMEQNGLTHLN